MDRLSILPLRVEGLGFSRKGADLLRGINFTLAAGPPLLVIGPNGAGKSTLLRLLHGLETPDAGRIHWAAPGGQAMVFQRPVLLRRSVLENVLYPLRGPDAAMRAAAALELVGLTNLMKRPARQLSGGEQQRLALARAAAMRPQVLFLDEPTASLDPAATRAVEAIVARLAAGGTQVVMTTHDLGQARRLAGTIAFLHGGCLLECGAAPAFFAQPATPEGAAFLRGDLTW